MAQHELESQNLPIEAETPRVSSTAEARALSNSDTLLGLQERSSLLLPVSIDLETGSNDDAGFQARYEPRGLLGRGGMGEVHLCKDHRIGREVALKVIRTEQGRREALRARFIREARVQGQLEHPAIVPVYDMGQNPAGDLYFTMKRIRGVSLEEILTALRAKEPAMVARYSRRRLLTAFSNICLTIDFAHNRGVIHRDLKPGNIMLGDFGEVYLLDWGLARLVGPRGPGESPESGAENAAQSTVPAAQTALGQIMGTVGYMAPEQVRGEIADLDGRTDVYALGAILFEILTLMPFLEVDNPNRALFQTAQGIEARPSVRAPEVDVPPELETICVHSTALSPSDRYPTARALHEALERFLDGDRDLMLRQELSQTHSLRAEAAAERALSATAVAEAATNDRRIALREVGQALALDPKNSSAARTFIRLLAEPPLEIPVEAQEALDDSTQEMMRFANATSAVAYLAWLTMVPLLLWMGIRDWLSFPICSGAILAAGVISALAVHARDLRTGAKLGFAVVAANFIMVVAGSRMFGPFVMIPGVVAMISLGLALRPEPTLRRVALIAGCLSIALPLTLEWLGLWSSSYLFLNGALVIHPHMLSFSKVPTILFLLLCSLAVAVSSFTFIERVRVAQMSAERRLQFQTWNLRQMVPQEAETAVQSSVPATSPSEP